MANIDKQLERIRRGAVEIISEGELIKKLKKNRPLVIKAGFDPTVSDIHLGHTVLLRKLRQFQDLGHKVIFLIGDATALIGDPSGQSQTRKTLTWDEVEKNARTYEKQVGKILDVQNSNLFERKHNSEWFSRRHSPGAGPLRTTRVVRDHFTFDFFTGLAQKYTVARLLKRDDFQKRLKENKPISFLELFYPLMQGYDSVKLKSDVELGGTDQKFNMLVGRNLQQAYGQEPQVVITLPLLEGLDGSQKMSKSLGNYVGLYESPKEIFGKLMSIPDSLIIKYCELLTDFPMEQIKEMRNSMKEGSLNPKDAKEELAFTIVSTYYTQKDARDAREEFKRVFSNKTLPRDLQELKIDKTQITNGKIKIVELLTLIGFAKTNNEARRLVSQGGVRFNGTKIHSPDETLEALDGGVLQVGKRRFIKLVMRL